MSTSMPARRGVFWSWCAAAVLLALLAWACRAPPEGPPPAAEVSVPDGWTMADLLRELGPLGLRVVPANSSGDIEDGVYLTATRLSWEELASLCVVPPSDEVGLACWRGTVFVRAIRPRYSWPLGVGGPSVLHAGRFHFYGDPELLDRVARRLAG